MVTEPAQVRIMREALEGVLSPKLAQAVLFEALGDSGTLPSTSEDLLQLVRGPVQEAVRKRSGGSEAGAVVERIEDLLGRRTSRPPPNPEHAEATVAVPTQSRAVPVLVISSGPWFGGRLSAALGPDRVAPVYASDAEGVRAALTDHGATIVVVDATDFPPLEPQVLASVLHQLPTTTTAAIWGADLPYGRRTAFALEEAGVEATSFPRHAGIDPLLDLVRARRRQ
ncbi:MAG: hypothetical protein ACOCXM_04135 [Myxococcota bacterium]